MDQMSSVMARSGSLMLLDCRSLAVEHVPLDPALTVLVAESGVRHELVAGEYAARRRQCEAAADALGVAALRDATPESLEAARDRMAPAAYRRARHVIGEIRRTLDAADALRRGDSEAAGALMVEGHASMRDDFEASCPELDLLVAIAADLGVAGGVLGARMTGGGFGGSTVSLVRTDAVDSVREALQDRYESETGRRPAVFATRPAPGALVLRAE
jgi:galactokinase